MEWIALIVIILMALSITLTENYYVEVFSVGFLIAASFYAGRKTKEWSLVKK